MRLFQPEIRSWPAELLRTVDHAKYTWEGETFRGCTTALGAVKSSSAFKKRSSIGLVASLDLVWTGQEVMDRWDWFAALPERERHEFLLTAAPDQLARYAQRGTDCHSILQHVLTSDVTVLDGITVPEAVRRAPLICGITKHIRRVMASEIVCLDIKRKVGGQADGFVELVDERACSLDMKTRTEDRQVDEVYSSEFAQCEVYASGTFCIADGEGHPVAVPVPETTHLAVFAVGPTRAALHVVERS